MVSNSKASRKGYLLLKVNYYYCRGSVVTRRDRYFCQNNVNVCYANPLMKILADSIQQKSGARGGGKVVTKIKVMAHFKDDEE